jgi:hypothetical protein
LEMPHARTRDNVPQSPATGSGASLVMLQLLSGARMLFRQE